MQSFFRRSASAFVVLALAGCSDEGIVDEHVGEVAEAIQACPPNETVLGIDIASYQHPNGAAIDWGTVAQTRRFVIVKATEGVGYTNPYHDGDIAGAKAAGMITASYHWLHYDSSGAAQAQYFLSAIGGVPDGDLPPLLDVEEVNDSSSPGERTAIMKEWLDTVEAATGRKAMIYSGSWYWGPYMGSPGGYAGVYPMVWAAYVDGCPNIPDDFPGITMWQYLGGQGYTPGINADCDQDMFYGSEADLLALANGGPDYRGESLGVDGQSYPIVADGAVTVAQGETVTGWVKLKNTGKKAWAPGTVWLAPIPRDEASPFQSPSWENDHRISTVTATVAPGDVGEFELDITGKDLGESIFSLGWVAEGETWFADPPKGGGPADGYFAVKVAVVEGRGAGGGSTVNGAGGSDPGGNGAGGDDELLDQRHAPPPNCACRIGATERSSTPSAPVLAGLAISVLAGLSRRRRRTASA